MGFQLGLGGLNPRANSHCLHSTEMRQYARAPSAPESPFLSCSFADLQLTAKVSSGSVDVRSFKAMFQNAFPTCSGQRPGWTLTWLFTLFCGTHLLSSRPPSGRALKIAAVLATGFCHMDGTVQHVQFTPTHQSLGMCDVEAFSSVIRFPECHLYIALHVYAQCLHETWM